MPEIFAAGPSPIVPLGSGRRDEFAAAILGQHSPVGAYRLPVLRPISKELRIGEMAIVKDVTDALLLRNARGEQLRLAMNDGLTRIHLDPEDLVDLEEGQTLILREDAEVFERLSENLAERYGTPSSARFLRSGSTRIIDAEGIVVYEGTTPETLALEYFRHLAMNGRMVAGLYLLSEDAGALELDAEALPRLAWPQPTPEGVIRLLHGMGLGEWRTHNEGATLRREIKGLTIEVEIRHVARVRAFGTIPYTLSGETPGRSFGELPYTEREAAIAVDDPDAAAALVIAQLQVPGLYQDRGRQHTAGYSLHVPGTDSPVLCAVEPFAEITGVTHYLAAVTHAGARLLSWSGSCLGISLGRVALLKGATLGLPHATPETCFRHHWGMRPSELVTLNPVVGADLDRRVRLIRAVAAAISQIAA